MAQTKMPMLNSYDNFFKQLCWNSNLCTINYKTLLINVAIKNWNYCYDAATFRTNWEVLYINPMTIIPHFADDVCFKKIYLSSVNFHPISGLRKTVFAKKVRKWIYFITLGERKIILRRGRIGRPSMCSLSYTLTDKRTINRFNYTSYEYKLPHHRK